jgi:hypothetical protein
MAAALRGVKEYGSGHTQLQISIFYSAALASKY